MTGELGSVAAPQGTAVLAIDTATTQVVVALGGSDGAMVGEAQWTAGHRHGERLLPSIGRLLAEAGVAREDLAGIIVGTGPGAFTGLRVGLATAKGLAHGLRRPIAGVPTSEALIAAAAAALGTPASSIVLLLPAGPTDRVVARAGGSAARLAGNAEPELAAGDLVVALDLEGRAPADAVERGEAARAGFGRELLRLGAARLTGRGDDLAELVPEYVTPPRGVAATSGVAATGGEVSWSHGPR